MSFYGEESLRELTHERRYLEEVAISLSAIDCVVNGKKAVYASSELTSGVNLYRILAEHGVADSAALREKLGQSWWQNNVYQANANRANDFARSLRLRPEVDLVITPAPFSAPEWTQPEYLHFWEQLIHTRMEAVYFNHDWQYSNGCTFEYAVALDAGLPRYDADHNELPGEAAIELIEQALREIESRGFNTFRLEQALGFVKRAAPPAAAS